MAHHKSDEKVVYVGDSRVRKYTKNNVPQDYSAYPGKTEAFVPNFLLKEWMIGAIISVGFMVLVMSEAAPLGYPADPTNTQFIPMPDWYFLFMYQLLKYPYASEHFKILGTLAIPGVAFGALFLAPFLDAGKERRFYRRPIAALLMITAVIAVIHLTFVSWGHYQDELKARGIVPEHIQRELDAEAGKEVAKKKPAAAEESIALVDDKNPAYDVYKKSTCIQCHGDSLKGMPTAGIPALLGVGDKYSKEEIVDIMKNGINNMPAKQWEASIANGLTDQDLDSLADWLAKQKKAQ